MPDLELQCYTSWLRPFWNARATPDDSGAKQMEAYPSHISLLILPALPDAIAALLSRFYSSKVAPFRDGYAALHNMTVKSTEHEDPYLWMQHTTFWGAEIGAFVKRQE